MKILYSNCLGINAFYKQYQAKSKRVIKKIGLNPELYSMNSFHRGGCTYSFRSAVTADLIQIHRDWKSDAIKKYVSLSFEDTFIVVEKMRLEILK